MSRRSRAREIALQVLFQNDMNSEQPDNVRDRFIQARLNDDRVLIDFAETLIQGVRQNIQAIDEQLENAATNWKLARMAATDRNVLRLGAFEILHSNIDDRIAINEAIELAKRYGTSQSAQFVNGILDRLMNEKSGSGQVDSKKTNPENA